MEKRALTREMYTRVTKKVEKAGGDVSYAAKKRRQNGKGLHPLVDPKAHGLIRQSLPRYTGGEGSYILPNGIPVPVENLLDTTGSMGDNVDIAFKTLLKSYNLIGKVMPRRDLQIANAIFGDVDDRIVLYRSQFEMDEQIPTQLNYMEAEYAGSDYIEDPEYGLFAAAYLTDAQINRYGLKSYHMLVTDAPGRGRITHETLIRVFGEDVYDKVKENGHNIVKGQLPNTKQIVTDLKKNAHAFMFLVDDSSETRSFWEKAYGKEYIVQIGDTDLLPYFQASVIGLTEGTLDLESLQGFLTEEVEQGYYEKRIVRAVAGIPLGVQRGFENYDKLPLAGAVFSKKRDLWPIDAPESSNTSAEGDVEGGEEEVWL